MYEESRWRQRPLFRYLSGDGEFLVVRGVPLSRPVAPKPALPNAPPKRGRIEVLKEPVLRVETTPAGATVSIDGRARGKSPVELPLKAGEYRLRAELEGYKPVERAIRYNAAGDACLRVTLKEEAVPTAFCPMTSEQAGEVQAAAGEALGLPVEITNSIGMKLRLIPAGEFLMGSPESEKDRDSDERPQHRVRITRPFCLGVYEVTQAEFEQVMETNPSHFQGSAGFLGFFARPPKPTHPVENVSWNDAQEFCRRLSAVEGRSYRLPTEAEWEYACRAGTTTRYCFGDDPAQLGQYAWFSENSGDTTHPAGQKHPNSWGLYDMHGNVWEWCAEWFDEEYYANSPVDDPEGPASGSMRVFRGGSLCNSAGSCRSAHWRCSWPDFRSFILGFRLALVPADESSK